MTHRNSMPGIGAIASANQGPGTASSDGSSAAAVGSAAPSTERSSSGGGGAQSDDRPAKRRKENHVRSRVSRACDRCKERKTRCSGKCPCTLCSQLGLECQFTAAYRRGRLPSIELETDEHVLQMAATAHHARRHSTPGRTGSAARSSVAAAGGAPGLDDAMPSPISIEQHHIGPDAHHHHNHHQAAAVAAAAGLVSDPQNGLQSQQQGQLDSTSTTVLSSRNSPEPSQNDQQGHYVGPASGASFLLRIQRKLVHQQSSLSSESSIFTFGDLPLPDFDPSFFILPPQADAEHLLARYFDFASATHRFLHRPTVEGWLRELYETNGAMRHKADARSRTAVLFMVFAAAGNVVWPWPDKGAEAVHSSTRFFSAAEHQLSAEKGEIRLTSVQARLAQCLYLLSQSRINHCWSLFGTTAHLVLALGMHRKRRVDSAHSVDYVELECRKRTFWVAYNLDNYLSAALGRPRTFHDEDIDQEMPECVNDSELTHRQIIPTPVKSQSMMSGCIAHMKLSRIIANILRDLYGIKQPSPEDRFRLAVKYNDELNDWRSSLSYLLHTPGIDHSLFLPVFLRQRNVLNLAFWHAQILVHRPFLLSNFAGLTKQSTIRSRLSGDPKLAFHVQQCLDAATNIARIVDELTTIGQLYSSFWFTHYFAFCAVVVLYVFTLQQRLAPSETYAAKFHAATRCQGQILSVATKGSLAERYGVVLEELRLEVLRHNHYLAAQYHHHPASAAALLGPEAVAEHHGQRAVHDVLSHDGGSAMGAAEEFQQLSAAAEPFVEASPSSSIAQLTGWGQFDSLVTGGVGSLESLLADGIGTWDLDLSGSIGNMA